MLKPQIVGVPRPPGDDMLNESVVQSPIAVPYKQTIILFTKMQILILFVEIINVTTFLPVIESLSYRTLGKFNKLSISIMKFPF